MTRLCLSWIILVLAILGRSDGFSSSSGATCPRSASTALQASSSDQTPMSRLSFLQTTVAAAGLAVITGTPSPASAKEVDPKIKGTKQDPAYESCVSLCLYDCTKPKGSEQKSRSECIPECKKQCATTKQQLMVGTPVEK